MSYCYNGMSGLSAGELFFWIMADKALQQLGVQDVAAMFAIIAGQPILPTRGKFSGATKGTSVVSVVVVGWSILAYDITVIMRRTIQEYNIRVSSADRCPQP